MKASTTKKGTDMSYDIALNCPVTGKILELDKPHQMKGGTLPYDPLNVELTDKSDKFFIPV